MTITPAAVTLTAHRTLPFSASVQVVGIDLTGGAVAAQIRLTAAAPGAALATFTVSAVSVTTPGGETTNSFTMSLLASDINALPTNADGSPATFAWDMVVTPGSGSNYVLLYGPLIVVPVVTHG